MLDVFCEFVRCWINSILYLRQVYPPGISILLIYVELFEKCKSFGVPVHQTCNSQLAAYIQQILHGIRSQLCVNNVANVSLIICTVNGRVPLEKFILEICQSQFLADNHKSTVENNGTQIDEAVAAFRSCLLKVCFCDSVLEPLPDSHQEELTFFVAVKLSATVQPAGKLRNHQESFPWHKMESIDTEFTNNCLTIPFKSILLKNVCKIQIYAQELRDKKKLFTMHSLPPSL